MKYWWLPKIAIIIAGFFSLGVWATDVNCGRIDPDLCTTLNTAKNETDTFKVSIYFYFPETSIDCKDVDPKTDTTGKCKNPYEDSTYRARLRANADTLFSKFILWDFYHPNVRMHADSGAHTGFQALMGTKATLILIGQETYINRVSTWNQANPLNIGSKALLINSASVPNAFVKFDVQGKRIHKVPVHSLKGFKVIVDKRN